MNGVNKVILIGNLGAEPEARFTSSGTAVTNISIATSESWKDKESGEKQERTEWHQLVFYGRLAEVAAQYLNTGSKIYVEGKLQTDKWEDKEGITRYTTKIIVNNLQMLDKKNEDNAPAALPSPNKKGDEFNDDIPW